MKVLKLKNLAFPIFVLALMLVSNTSVSAQSDKKEEVYTAENAGWLVNLDEAYKISKANNKPILANFTGSDWCGWCKKLTASVFVHDEFKKWADKNVVLLELDYPRRKTLPAEVQEQNQGLQQAFQVRGYPTVWLFDLNKDEGKNQYSIEALGKTGYTATVGEFTSALEQMMATRS